MPPPCLGIPCVPPPLWNISKRKMRPPQVCACVRVCVHACTHEGVSVRMRGHMWVCMGVCVCVCSRMCVCVCALFVCVCVCMHAEQYCSLLSATCSCKPRDTQHSYTQARGLQSHGQTWVQSHTQTWCKCCMSAAGSDKDTGQYGASSSDSEEESPTELQLTGRRPSTTNYRPEFAAKTLAQASHAGPPCNCHAMAINSTPLCSRNCL